MDILHISVRSWYLQGAIFIMQALLGRSIDIFSPCESQHHAYTFITVNNPVISIPQSDLTNQADSLGTPITTVLNSPSFADVAPTGLVIPQIGGPGMGPGNGATKTFLTFTPLFLMLIFSFFGI